MPFPFVAPFDNWTKTILKHREGKFDLAMCRNPFAVLTSPAYVAARVGASSTPIEERVKEFKNFIDTGKAYSSTTTYKGCIIANNIANLDLSYRTKETALGVDFDGKIITVQGETDRRVSTPIIESIDIDTDGANNTTKTATINVKCFTLKQLELFEMFFMRIGMNILLEYGDAALLSGLLQQIEKKPNADSNLTTFRDGKQKTIGPYSRIEEALIQKTDHGKFVKEFNDYFRMSLDGLINYYEKTEKSYGTYDFVAGVLSNYSFSINDDLTYNVQLSVTQANQLTVAIPNNPKNTKATVKNAGDSNIIYSEDQIMQKIVYDFDLDADKFKKLLDDDKEKHPKYRPPSKDSSKDEKNENPFIKYDTFNFVRKNEKDEDQQASITPYVSLRFILKLLNYSVISTGANEGIFSLEIPEYYSKSGNEKGKKIQIVPVLSHKNIISSNESVIFPTNEMPAFKINKGSSEDKILIDDEKNRIDGRINGYNFHLPQGTRIYITSPSDCKVLEKDRIGNALNIFINYYEVVRNWKQNIYRIDFLKSILDIINKSSHGLFLLIYANPHENGKATVIDFKFSPQSDTADSEQHRFKLSPNQSILKQLSFNVEMSDLVAGMTLMNNNIFVNKLKKNKDSKTKISLTDEIPPPDDQYKSVDRSIFVNADDWYSFNPIELLSADKRRMQDEETRKASQSGDTSKVSNITIQDLDKTEEKPEEEKLEDVIEQSYVKFKIPTLTKTENSATPVPLIFKNAPLIKYLVTTEDDNDKGKQINRAVLTYIDITITIDGFSGFRCGQCFRTDGVPEIYNIYGYFQIQNIKHSLNESGWTTTLEAGWRNNMN